MGKYMSGVPLGVFDLTRDPSLNLVDESIVTVTLQTPADMVHKIFRQLGNKVILVKKGAYLAGLITKKSFIRHMEAQHALHQNQGAGQHDCESMQPHASDYCDHRTSTLREARISSAS